MVVDKEDFEQSAVRAALEILVDPENASVTLLTPERAARGVAGASHFCEGRVFPIRVGG